MKDKRRDLTRLLHILDSIKEIESYITGVTFLQFQENSMIRYASIKHLEIIGEAANHISENLKLEIQDIKWPEIIALRNVLIHEYFGIDIKIIWDIIHDDLPEVKEKIKRTVDLIS